jgi:hypothetical protein
MIQLTTSSGSALTEEITTKEDHDSTPDPNTHRKIERKAIGSQTNREVGPSDMTDNASVRSIDVHDEITAKTQANMSRSALGLDSP